MNEWGLWELFCKTGLPAAYLAVAGQRQEDGKRVLDAQILKTIPVRDFRTICRQVQGFLLRAGSASEKTDSGSTKRS